MPSYCPRLLVALVIAFFLSASPVALWAQGDKGTAAAAAPAEPADRPPQGFFEILFSGGPIGIAIMLVLIGLSLTAAYLVFEQMLSLRKKELIPPELSDEVRQLVVAGQLERAAALCRERPSLLAFVISHGLSEAEGGWSEVEKATEDALAEQAARLFRRVEYLAVLGNIAPMVGLLGTVTGMLMSFKEVADTEGHAGATQLAEGIYQALVTTVVGLIIAIPALGAFAIFRNRVDQFVAEAAYAALHALSPLKKGTVAAAPCAGSAATGATAVLCPAAPGSTAGPAAKSESMKIPTRARTFDAGINMTPMIDVVFQLIIFFLVTSHFAKQEAHLPLPLPAADSSEAAKSDDQPRLVINVTGDGTLLFAGRSLSAEELRQQLSGRINDLGKDIEVRIRADRSVPYRHVEPVLLACARVGIWNVNYAVYRREDVK